jgi:hypothetical protein
MGPGDRHPSLNAKVLVPGVVHTGFIVSALRKAPI